MEHLFATCAAKIHILNGTHYGTHQKRVNWAIQSKSTEDLESSPRESSPSFWRWHLKEVSNPGTVGLHEFEIFFFGWLNELSYDFLI